MNRNGSHKAHILLVEDDQMARASTQRILESHDYQVTSVSDGETACMLLRTNANGLFDVVLTDLLMRSVDGIEVSRVARDLPDPPEVVVLTGYGSMGTAIGALRAGVFDYVLKPCKPEDLLRTVDAALERRVEQTFLIMRRHDQSTASTAVERQTPRPRRWRIGELLIDRLSGRVTFQGILVQLTPTEHNVLRCLAEALGETVSFSEIARRAYPYSNILEHDEAHQLIKTHIHNLRNKIAAAYIVNVRGVGYRLLDPRA